MNLPSAFLTRMQEMLGEEYEAFLQSYESGHYQSLRLNPRKTDREEFTEKSPFHLTPVAWEKNGFYYSEEDTPGKHPYHEAGVYYIQEASAMAPVGYLDVQPGDYVLDLCAAPGGKTILLAEQMQGTGALYSCDAAENRVGLIRTAVDRMGFTGVHTLCNDATKPNPALPMADRILTDVPCSGLGILAKKPDLRYKKLEAARQAELLATQAAILDTAAALLKAGGRLVYSTCTIDPAENQQQIAAFLQRHPEFAVCAPEVPLPAGMTAGEHGCLSVPTRTGMDGFFLCVLQKAAATQ